MILAQHDLAVDPARVEAADARVLRPTREDMLDRISGQSNAADGKFACLECGERFESLAAVDKHRRATHQMAMRNDANAQRNGVPAICPECESHFGTLQQLQRHFARKHVTERQFQCASCGLGFKADTERRAHEGMCIEGLNRGKAIRCEQCGIICMSQHQWRQHRKITKHTTFELQWVDSAAMAAATAEATSAEAAAAAARHAMTVEPAVAPLVGLVPGHELAADEGAAGAAAAAAVAVVDLDEGDDELEDDLDEGDDELEDEDEDEAARLGSRGAHAAEGLPSAQRLSKKARTSSSSGLVGAENERPDVGNSSAHGEAAVKPEAGAPPLWPGASLVGEGSQGDPILCL